MKLLAVFYLTLAILPLQASTIFTLPGDALPSTVGWTYFGNLAQGTAVTTSPGQVVINSIGGPSGDGAYYLLPNVIPSGVVEVVWRMQITSSTGTFGFYVQVDDGAHAWLVAFSTSQIYNHLAVGGSVPYDSTGVHDYRFVVDTSGLSGGQLFVDGGAVPVFTTAVVGTIDGNSVLFGDGTSYGNARTVVFGTPEPSTGIMVIGGLSLFAGLRNRKLRNILQGVG